VIEDGATVQNTVVLPGAHVGPRARLRNVIVAREGVVASGDQIGFDPESDSVRFGLTRSGIAVVGPDERRETTWPVMSSPTQREARLTAG
jgi:glucose-1-phosphate adenylyltransferase